MSEEEEYGMEIRGNYDDEDDDEGVDLFEEKEEQEPPSSKRHKKEEDEEKIVRPGFQVTDNTSYYNLASLYVLLYAHVKEGVSIPALFSASTKGFETNNVQFDF